MPKMTFDQFNVGDSVSFERIYTKEDIDAFAHISGDYNPLHVDEEYAANTPFKKTLVQLQLLHAPFSAIAGMIFPGVPSLCLSQESKALATAFADDHLTYSAKILSIDSVLRILTVRILILRGTDVLLESLLKVQSREAEWEQQTTPWKIQRIGEAKTAFVTGGSGEIGSAAAFELARSGLNLFLQDRGNENRRQEIWRQLSQFPVTVRFISADLESAADISHLAEKLQQDSDIALYLHAASSNIDAGVPSLVSTNYTSLRTLSNALLPTFLARQSGTIAFISSLATEQCVSGMEDYAAAKAMADNFIHSFERKFSHFDIRGLSILAGRVKTRFSANLPATDNTLLPAELAESLVSFVLSPPHQKNVLLFEAARKTFGVSGFRSSAAKEETTSTKTVPVAEEATSDITSTISQEQAFYSIFRRHFRLGTDTVLEDCALGVTPGWDSLNHINLILVIEKELNIRFSTEEMNVTTNFASLLKLVSQKEKNA